MEAKISGPGKISEPKLKSQREQGCGFQKSASAQM